MDKTGNFWDDRVYRLVIAGCGIFIVLTLIAMLIYPGGSIASSIVRKFGNPVPSKGLSEDGSLDGGFVVEAAHRPQTLPQRPDPTLQRVVGTHPSPPILG